MRSSCINAVGPKSDDMDHYKKRTHSQKRRHARKEPYEDGGRSWNHAKPWPHTKECLELSESGKAKEFSPRTLERLNIWWHLNFGLLASRMVGKYIFVVLSPQVCGCLFWQPSEANTWSSISICIERNIQNERYSKCGRKKNVNKVGIYIFISLWFINCSLTLGFSAKALLLFGAG